MDERVVARAVAVVNTPMTRTTKKRSAKRSLRTFDVLETGVRCAVIAAWPSRPTPPGEDVLPGTG